MSKPKINEYYNNLERAVKFGKTKNEETIKSAFHNLLNDYARKKNYEVCREVFCMGTKGKNVRPDGILKNIVNLDVGYWESKDEKDDLNDEIDAKLKKGYPFTNILFEDSKTAVLFQRAQEVCRVQMNDADKLDEIIEMFISYKSESIVNFELALVKFKEDIPAILETLRKSIDIGGKTNKNFIASRDTFFELCKEEINPDIALDDVREMMIQHVLTSDIFNKIFDNPEFHKHNTIAKELEKLIDTLYSYKDRKDLLSSIAHYYDAIKAAASSIVDHHDKQKFLKVIYENFYKVYNPKAADKLGVVYTPNEIVKFMVETVDHLLYKFFNKSLSDKNVEILDPATGTGTFVTEIIEHIPNKDLKYKFKNEIHANEVAILPYYIANLNIEFAFTNKMGYYEEFENICFVDTLDNIASLSFSGKQHTLFGLSSENSERIKRQNSKKISVVLGNPPYNANQLNENDNNKNRQYPYIDKRIKDTYIHYSTAQKTKVYDMYARFYRWASDRVDKNGIVAFITNNSFINARTFDGFRKSIYNEFDYAYIIDLGGNIRELSGKDGIYLNEENTIFGVSAAVGIAIMFLVKTKDSENKKCNINYIHPCDIRAKRTEKLDFICNNNINEIQFTKIHPDKNNNWINLAEDNDWEELCELDKLFTLNCNSVKTNRDEWVYDFNISNQIEKAKYFINKYNNQILSNKYDNNKLDYSIKWSRDLKNKLKQKRKVKFLEEKLIISHWRPFVKQYFYSEKVLNDVLTDNHIQIWGNKLNIKNIALNITDGRSNKDFHLLASSLITDYHFTGDTILISKYYNDKTGKQKDNLTDWGLEQFTTHYKDKKIKKEDIFNYVYGVLHNPEYRKKYELNLKREFPRIPFYKDFWQWAKWGEQLMKLHIDYEKVKPYKLKYEETKEKKPQGKQNEMFQDSKESESMFAHKARIKCILKADKEKGMIRLDDFSSLSGVPAEAWEYKLGNRSALEWILDQYKESEPSDPTIREKFNTYKFADYKEHVIDLLKRVCTVSVETIDIINQMK